MKPTLAQIREPAMAGKFSIAPRWVEDIFPARLSDGVMVAQGSLEAFVMVRIHVGQPNLFRPFSRVRRFLPDINPVLVLILPIQSRSRVAADWKLDS
jgi:hypothetical protein